MMASLKAFGLIAVPLACGIVLFAVTAPAQRPGVYVKSRQGVYPISGYVEQPATMFASIAGKEQSAPGTARGGVQFFVVTDASQPSTACTSARLFFVRIVEGESPDYRPIATDVRRLDPRVCHVSSGELSHWGDAPDPVVTYYYAAKAETSKPVKVLVALTLDNPDGSRQIYPVLNYPPSGPRLALQAF
jgi:hypothetical protein